MELYGVSNFEVDFCLSDFNKRGCVRHDVLFTKALWQEQEPCSKETKCTEVKGLVKKMYLGIRDSCVRTLTDKTV